MEITSLELRRLNFYRASELHGGLVLGQLIRRVRDPHLIVKLTRHSAEEVSHSQIWAETIVAVGGRPAPSTTYQARLAQLVGTPSSVFQVLALTQVFERRVYQHFIYHARLVDTHPIVRASLERMVEEEKDHLCWVKEWLEEEAGRRGIQLRTVLDQYAITDARVYGELLFEYGFRSAA